MSKVLFVCLGNICRSPLAEAIFDHKCETLKVADWESDSAGTAAYHVGEQPDPRSVEVARENGVSINHSARKFRSSDVDEFDFIFAMDQANYRDIVSAVGHRPSNLYLLRDFESNALPGSKQEVPDPYYGGPEGFSYIFELMSDCIDNFIRREILSD